MDERVTQPLLRTPSWLSYYVRIGAAFLRERDLLDLPLSKGILLGLGSGSDLAEELGVCCQLPGWREAGL